MVPRLNVPTSQPPTRELDIGACFQIVSTPTRLNHKDSHKPGSILLFFHFLFWLVGLGNELLFFVISRSVRLYVPRLTTNYDKATIGTFPHLVANPRSGGSALAERLFVE